jgi:biotin synthase
VLRWLTATDDLQQELFRRAREVRGERQGDGVVLRGVVEISSYCRRRCDYCAMRAPNRNLDRYRLSADQVLAVVGQIKRHGITTAFLQAGEDPHCDPLLEEVIPAIKQGLGMNVLLCVGQRPREKYRRFAELGADSFILKFESSDPDLYRRVSHFPLGPRVQCLHWIREAGLKLGTGNIVGLPGQTLDNIADDILFGLALRPDFVSCAPFIPNEGTPFEGTPNGDLNVTLNTMAIWRILLGDALIPAVSALEKLRPGGQLLGLNAGANVITINFTPKRWRDRYAIYSRERFVVSLGHARETIDRAGLRVVSPSEALAAVVGHP